jgi:hypothetical protein
MLDINMNNTIRVLSLKFYHGVWALLIKFNKLRNYDSVKYGAIVGLNSVSFVMVPHKKAKETFGSLYEWTLCVIALKREEKSLVAFLREQRQGRLTGLQIRAHRHLLALLK